MISNILLDFSYMTSLYVNFKASLAFKIIFTIGIMKTQKNNFGSLFAGRYKDKI